VACLAEQGVPDLLLQIPQILLHLPNRHRSRLSSKSENTYSTNIHRTKITKNERLVPLDRYWYYKTTISRTWVMNFWMLHTHSTCLLYHIFYKNSKNMRPVAYENWKILKFVNQNHSIWSYDLYFLKLDFFSSNFRGLVIGKKKLFVHHASLFLQVFH
jgi:hypothetical protein